MRGSIHQTLSFRFMITLFEVAVLPLSSLMPRPCANSENAKAVGAIPLSGWDAVTGSSISGRHTRCALGIRRGAALASSGEMTSMRTTFSLCV
mmetsp:Transcript_51443/g.115542  ORF Transcript_51443/g.115542 Transcript_51443/m.115542 type:complete len:93 (-) Transcript_51443:23-301(-)